ncbi:glycosyltransferase family 4 protein [Paenibacillus bouchesdurhonensis]|uniref:glycosyltransferase family 4 protein n=1 Tax=Paenibacillus bouchesdurhonensis TaxID=1870990 RepID=UPI000DA62FB6|nr:glycosyltransferase family 4 protein [Paenibacillus bouchesdurhonensis]
MSRTKKLLLFSHVCNKKNITGAEKLLLFLATKLAPYFQCVIVVPREGALTRLAAQSGIRTIVHNIPLLYGMCLPHEGLAQEAEDVSRGASFVETSRLLSHERPDYVLVNTSVHVIPAVAAKSLAIPVIWHITEVIANNEYAADSVRIIDQYSDCIICISESAAAPLRGCSSEKLSILYPSWSGKDFNPHLWPKLREQQRLEWKVGSTAKLIGYISSYLTAEKGADHFIELALELAERHEESRFVVIGGKNHDSFYSNIRRRVSESVYAGRFIFIDYVLNVESAYSAMDVVIVPSLKDEGFGLTAMEAMILGKPVVAYASGGLEEILRLTGNHPYLARTGNYHELSAKTSAILEHPELVESISDNNRNQIGACFGPEAYEANLQTVINKINSLPIGNVPDYVTPALHPAATTPKLKKRRAQRARRSSPARRPTRTLRRRRKAGNKSRTKRGSRYLRRTRRVSRNRMGRNRRRNKTRRTSTGR